MEQIAAGIGKREIIFAGTEFRFYATLESIPRYVVKDTTRVSSVWDWADEEECKILADYESAAIKVLDRSISTKDSLYILYQDPLEFRKNQKDLQLGLGCSRRVQALLQAIYLNYQASARLKTSPEQSSQQALTEDCAEKARKIVFGERQQQYGSPVEAHERIAKLWSLFLDTQITAREVCFMMMLLKIAREKGKPGFPDTTIDICGYSLIADMCNPDQTSQ